MLRVVLAHLAFRKGRTAALVSAVLAATLCFTLLTGSTSTSRLAVTGTVRSNYRPVYDILVRPAGQTQALERSQNLVQTGSTDSINGGITLQQWHRIEQIPDVAVAAPVAVIGYTMPTLQIPLDLSTALTSGDGSPQVLRIDQTWTGDRGLSRMTDGPIYVYATDHKLLPWSAYTGADGAGRYAPQLVGPDGRRTRICPAWQDYPRDASPFMPDNRQDLVCWSTATAKTAGSQVPSDWTSQDTYPYVSIGWPYPYLIVAVDPDQENKLVGLDRSVVSGRGLSEADKPHASTITMDQFEDVVRPGERQDDRKLSLTQLPILLADRPDNDEQLHLTVSRLPASAARQVEAGTMQDQLFDTWRATRGTVLQERDMDVADVHGKLIRQLTSGPYVDRMLSPVGTTASEAWATGPNGALAPMRQRNRDYWDSEPSGITVHGVPLLAGGDEWRALTPHDGGSLEFDDHGGLVTKAVSAQVVGEFDPSRLSVARTLAAAPMDVYAPAAATGADDASRKALGGRAMLPTGYPSGLIGRSATMITTLDALPLFHAGYSGFTPEDGKAPISAVRVRVSGQVTADPVSRERVRLVAERIRAATGLMVDITAGSSATGVRIDLPGNDHGRPALALAQPWVKKGVAVAVLAAVDRKSLLLLGLLLTVCALFVANAAGASAAARRHELGICAALGWPARHIRGLLLAETLAIGMGAGAVGTLAALPLARLLDIQLNTVDTLLALPAALAVTLVAGLPPAWRAGRADPAQSLRPAVLVRSRARSPRGVTSLAVANLFRAPGRLLLGATALAVGIASLTLLEAISGAFHGAVAGSVLGDAITVQVRGSDRLAAAATTLLGALSIADLTYVAIKERAAELSLLRASGWPEGSLIRLLVTEATGVGLLGSAVGAAAGLALTRSITGQLPAQVLAAAAATAAGGAVLAALAATASAQALRRLPTVQLLAGE
ncbi:FtsX-like permease family protein [Streptomyces sp. NPDC093064]|uniref:FtsX-like permease family protein n=1 Tax=Streptomyces sp. NPDC093064 TaxID=3366020 RepID=UPI0038102CF0